MMYPPNQISTGLAQCTKTLVEEMLQGIYVCSDFDIVYLEMDLLVDEKRDLTFKYCHVTFTFRGMAKHSFEKDMLTDLDKQIDELKDLNAEERQALKEWSEFFDGKYDVVGRLVNEASR